MSENIWPEGPAVINDFTCKNEQKEYSIQQGKREEAQEIESQIKKQKKQDKITWIDVTAPGDGCAFALCDPVAVSGVALPDSTNPLVVSAAFTKTLSKETWKRLRWKFFKLHFQYLCAFDRPGHYDYFRITAGPMTLADRFKGRKPSASRIVSAVNGYPDFDS